MRRKRYEESLPLAVEGIAGRAPGVVLSVDSDLRVLAWNRGIDGDLLFPAADILGRPCYELVSAVDTETGGPCHESCPVVRGENRPGWAHSRVLEVKGAEGRKIRMDCLLIKCLTPETGRSHLCFMDSPYDDKLETHTRILQVIEAVYPVASSGADVHEVLAVALKAVLKATSADGGEVFLVDRETGELAPSEHQGLPLETMEEFRRSVIGAQFPELFAEFRLPLLASGTWKASGQADVPGSYICAPLVAEGRVLGALGIVSQDEAFDAATATRILFPVAAQLGVYLGWALLTSERDGEPSEAAPTTATSRLQINCLGPFSVVLDGKPIPIGRFHRLKALTLLKFLVAHRGRPIPRETLMELLWPEADPARAGANLRVVLHTLRRTLEPDLKKGEASSFIISQRDQVFLDPSSRAWVDSEEFVKGSRSATTLVSQEEIDGSIEEYRRAASLYRGEYLEDEPYSDWCLFERERLKEVYINLCKLMASVLANHGQTTQAIDAYHTALGVDQGREEVHRELMILLWKDGRRDEAIRQFEVCRRILREELVVEPATETQTLYKAMLEGTNL